MTSSEARTCTRVRPPAVAGTFYPSSPDGFGAALRQTFADAAIPSPRAAIPKALIVPHAGYVYSGAIAASAYARIIPSRSTIRRVVLLGPSHRVYVRGLAVPSVDAFRSPLGIVPIDASGRDIALGLPGVQVDDRAHAEEHSLEVQLPFLQSVLDDFTLLPFSVGDATTGEVAAVLEACWGGPETLVVISTDLSHYHQYADARRLDRARRPPSWLAGRTPSTTTTHVVRIHCVGCCRSSLSTGSPSSNWISVTPATPPVITTGWLGYGAFAVV